MSLSLFEGYLKETDNEKVYNDLEYQRKIEALQAEIMQAHTKLQKSESRMAELQSKLDEYISKEELIVEVMIIAQVNAHKTEAQARTRAEILLQETDEELRRKTQELELLRSKTQLFKQEIYDRLDQYKTSLEKIMDLNDNLIFTPTLVIKDK